MKWLGVAWSGLRRHFSSRADGVGSIYDKLFVVQPRFHPPLLLKAKLLEALRLANSLAPLTATDLKSDFPSYVLVQGRRKINAGTYFGAGTIDNIRTHLNVIDVEDREIDAVFVNTSLSGVQQRNLEDAWERPVLDRVGLIIEIFGSRARSKEAKLQVELAALDFKRTRLIREKGERKAFGAGGEQEVVSARGASGGGGRGFTSGSGESELQLQRRRISDQKHKIQVALAKAKQTRSLHRRNREGIPLVAVVGYTNAGKSTLVGALSKSSLYSDDRLFATLDTQVRSVILPSGRRVLVSDTVGFISDLPTQLVEAFHATLEEVVAADIVLVSTLL
ncbi:hypothetical protein SELMODRAFT_91633 [Selaginella moellendorffii]|uniref:Hflx-type G domain-containing protein n=1 Tax=Selaginella moellendorffii TaxID=88036 RepID=D8REG0_SELML|nr:hypothetical protein SELMODRAFT_91633 [Selaginella moellendorffii]